MEILFKLLGNIVKNPSDDKYRQIKGTNKKIAETLFALKGASELLLAMGYQEVEPSVFLYIGEDTISIARYAHMVDDALMPLRMEFMTPEEREKTLLLLQRKAEFAAKKQAEREKFDLLKRQQEADRQEKAAEKVESSVGNKLEFGAQTKMFVAPVSKGG